MTNIDIYFCKQFYPFLKEWNYEEIKKHFEKNKNKLLIFKDKQELEKKICLYFYKDHNPDIDNDILKSNELLLKHWFEVGIDEYRLYNFDPEYYKTRYKDLMNLTDIQLLSHWYSIGRNENRICCPIIKKTF